MCFAMVAARLRCMLAALQLRRRCDSISCMPSLVQWQHDSEPKNQIEDGTKALPRGMSSLTEAFDCLNLSKLHICLCSSDKKSCKVCALPLCPKGRHHRKHAMCLTHCNVSALSTADKL